MVFKVLIHKRALKELEEIPEPYRTQIRVAIKEMTQDPFSGDVKPIKGLKGVLRKRVGRYRIGFTVDFEKGTVVVLKVGLREKFYEKQNRKK
uniref:Type II toxin-antitoxin system RelE/ParE family toxin n=1 Tax=Caldiarchaeum subterraneum TaxID=311458 RepID=E6NAV8_CALS0|nr:conserved hypothetical protein [Candidatus Caldarchaeum subterraneum]